MIRLIPALLILLTVFAQVHAQGYPTKTVRIIVPHGAGGPADVPPRGIAQSLAQILGKPFVIENREGADGVIGAEVCAKAPPDGYTLCSTTSSVITLNPAIHSQLPYDPPRDFVPLVYFGASNNALLVHPSMAVNSAKELFELARAKPDSITWGGMAATGTGSVVLNWLKNSVGASFYQIPYKSTVQAMQATVAGNVQVMAYAVGPSAGLVKGGKLKALAMVGGRRSPLLPDVPTMKELGYDFEYSSWFGMFAPARTPQDIVRRLNSEMGKLLADPQFSAKFLGTQGIDVDDLTGRSSEEFAAFLKTDRENVAKILQAAGIKKQ